MEHSGTARGGFTVKAAEYFEREFGEHLRVAEASRSSLGERFRSILALCRSAILDGHKLLFFGNGGSAADAQHFAAELVVRYRTDRRAMPAIALTTDTSTLTAGANDLGFDQVFARQIEALACPGDVAIGISTSGRSPNVLEAFRVAREMGLATVALSGGDGGELANRVDQLLIVPSKVTARIQEMHLTFGHLLCGALELEVTEVER
jgi:D-sedoheptulose 7-phosphate isomerase